MNNKRYRNKKNGNVYIVLNHAIDCTNERDGTKVVIYYPENNRDFLCVREENEFLIKFDEITNI
jgi:hypothetical protein